MKPIIAGALLLFSLGCRSNPKDYMLAAYLERPDTIFVSQFEFGGMDWPVGYLTERSSEKASLVPFRPIPREVEVSWRDQRGRHHRVVEVPPLPDNFEGWIYVRFQSAGLVVTPVSDDDLRQQRDGPLLWEAE